MLCVSVFFCVVGFWFVFVHIHEIVRCCLLSTSCDVYVVKAIKRCTYDRT